MLEMILSLLLLVQLELEMILLDVIRSLSIGLLMWLLNLEVMLSLGDGLWDNIGSSSYIGKGRLSLLRIDVLQVAFSPNCIDFSIIFIHSNRLLSVVVRVQELVYWNVLVEVDTEVANFRRRQRLQMGQVFTCVLKRLWKHFVAHW